MSGFHRLRVSRVDRLCDDAVAVSLDVPAELSETFRFAPGQFLTLRRTVDGRDERRSYSICAGAGEPLRVGVREVPDGLFSRWLVHEVRVGDEIEVHPPQGSFVADPASGGRHVLVAAGSGITPMLALARSLLGCTSAPNPARVTLVYGNRRSTTVMFAEELADLKDTHLDRFELVHVLSREPREVDLFSGRLDADRLRRLLPTLVPDWSGAHFWLCGPFGMLTDARQVLRELGVPTERVHVELFYVEDTAPAPVRHLDEAGSGPTSEVTVVLDGRATTAALSADEPLLDAAQRARADLPFACKGGVCGTCRAKVTAGEVELRRNYALEDAEVAAGFVLTCQSYPLTAQVTVDFDA